MWAVSPAFLAALRSPDQRNAVRVVASTGDVLSVADGAVDMDSRRAKTRTATLSLTPTDDLSHADVYDLVMTPGVELTIYRGLYVDGVPELVPLGVMSTDSCPRPTLATRGLSWTGTDRSKKISRARSADVWPVTAGTPLATVGRDFVAARWPQAAVDLGNVTDTINVAFAFEAGANSDPWDQIRTTFSDHGYDLAFDGAGTLRARLTPDPATVDPVFDFGRGNAQLVESSEMTGSFDQVYSGVIATGEGSGIETPTRGECWDTDPASPTYWPRAGRIPYFLGSSLLDTPAKAQRAAETTWARIKGRRETLSWESLVNPALEPLDVVAVHQSRYALDKLKVPLKASARMTGSARETRIA